MRRTKQDKQGRTRIASSRQTQLAYSDLQPAMLDERLRKQKAAKIVAVLEHFLGRADLDGLVAADIGCSAGFITDTLREAGASVTGYDIDEPGLERARARFGASGARFVHAYGDALPVPDASVDVVVFNHIYEHVVDADSVMTEIRRVLKPDGVVYLGLANRLGVIEPHYKLPFLSWLPRPVAHRYVRAFGRADNYHEAFRTRPGLRRMCKGLNIWDYTYTVLSQSRDFHADDMVPPRLADVPVAFWKSLAPIMPTFIWVGTPGHLTPTGPVTRVRPRHIVRS